jgi:NitT/TauT family transport system substrate-binding protein
LVPRTVRAQAALPRVRIASTTDEDIIGAVYGVQTGAFAKAGIDVEVTKANNGAATAAAVVGGAIDIGKSSSMGIVNAHARGIPLRIVAAAAMYGPETNEDAGLVVAKEGPIHVARDLEGRTLSVPALHDLFTVAMSAWIDQHGGDSKSVKFVELPNSAAPEAVATGRVDGATIANPQLSLALASGKVRVIGHSFEAIATRFMSAVFFCTADYLAKNRDAVARFRRVLYESDAYINSHHAETVDLLSRYTGIEPKVIAAMPRATLGTTLDPRLLQPLIDRAVQYQAIPKSFDAKEMFDPGGVTL